MATVFDVARRLGLSDEGSSAEVADRIVDFAGRRDHYRAAARVLKLAHADVLSSRSARCFLARLGVWAALRGAGRSLQDIGRMSTPAREWDHSTVRSGLLRLEGLAEHHRAFARAAEEATKAQLEADSKARTSVR